MSERPLLRTRARPLERRTGRLPRAQVILTAIFLLALLVLTACGGGVTYIVQSGDTLDSIARSHNVSTPALLAANRDRYPQLEANSENLRPGMELAIPSGEADQLGLEEWVVRFARAVSPPVTPAPSIPAATNEKIDATVELILQGINRERGVHNVKPLSSDATLTRMAQQRSNDMISRQYFSHSDPQSGAVLFQDLLKEYQYRYLTAGENIAEIRNQGTFVPSGLTVYARYSAGELADQFVTGWINSPEHFENIVNPRFRNSGIALGVSVDGTRIVATQIFSD